MKTLKFLGFLFLAVIFASCADTNVPEEMPNKPRSRAEVYTDPWEAQYESMSALDERGYEVVTLSQVDDSSYEGFMPESIKDYFNKAVTWEDDPWEGQEANIVTTAFVARRYVSRNYYEFILYTLDATYYPRYSFTASLSEYGYSYN